jgi:hypothetical protein
MAFCAAAELSVYEEDDIIEHDDILHADAAWISDDENEEHEEELQNDSERLQIGRQAYQPDGTLIDWSQPVTTNFTLDGPIDAHVIPNEEDKGIDGETNTIKLLKYHQRMGHISFTRLQTMAKMGLIPRELRNCPIPACSACIYGKQTRKPWRTKHKKNHQSTPIILQPGDVVSVDQMQSPTPGLIAQMTGKLTSMRYRYATIYVDQASRLGFIYLQKSADAKETLEGKALFEKYAQDRGITIKRYHADNGIFKAHAWVNDCQARNQGLTFAGVNAHHQNGIAEKRIRDLQELARTQMIFAKRRWPKAIEVHLWPYALRMANQILNETPLPKDPTHRSSTQIFTSSLVDHNPKHFKPFGCPVYVLDESLQSSGGIHGKWKDRSRVGVYLGQSPKHNRNVALVLSLETGLVSPQFHVEFDEGFHTVKQEEKWQSRWQERAGFITATASQNSTNENPNKRSLASTTIEDHKPEERIKRSKENNDNQRDRIEKELSNQREQEPATSTATTTEEHQKQPLPERMEIAIQLPTQEGAYTRYGRRVKPNPKYAEAAERLIVEASITEAKNMKTDVTGEIMCFKAIAPTEEADKHPLQCWKVLADPDTMYHHQAMKEPDADKFLIAMKKEVEDQYQNGNFTIIPKSQLPKGATVLPAVWQMRRKRDIKTREIKKYKARLNIDGSKMRPGKHYDINQTYAPVASWNSIRLLLTMTVVHNWKTRQLDYVLAFPQAPVDREIYMNVPKGFEIEGGDEEYVLQLHKNVYGQKQAGRVWNDYLRTKLVKIGFVQSKYDECVYFRGSVMYVLYTDDSILAGPNDKDIEQAIEDIKSAGLNITVEGDLQDFLGVNIERRSDGTIHLTQPHLIDQILNDLRLDQENVAIKTTPARSSSILRTYPESKPFDGHFNYRSVIGKLNYLERGSRPDIAYIVHQCARFASDPKVEHGAALKWLGRYLKGTRNKGMILKPKQELDLEVYVDADFAGNWNQEEAEKRDTARSRHGYIITYAGVPISWKSQLQGEICLSSTESEYTGLSHALREAIPIMETLKEMKQLGFPIQTSKSKVHCRVFEDNSGALEMAKIHKYRPRTKHICTKLHHFRDYVMRGDISIHPIDTKMQPADFLTKPLNEDTLKVHRRTIMGW